MGAVVDVVRRYVPSTYRALVEGTAGNAALFSTTDLQALADYVQYKLFSTVAGSSSEATVYNPVVLQFLGKLTTLQFIPAAVDYWDATLESKTTTGTDEVIDYRDHSEDLWRIFEELAAQVKDDFVEIGIALKPSLVPQVSYGDNGRGILKTLDPHEFPGMNEEYRIVDILPWRVQS